MTATILAALAGTALISGLMVVGMTSPATGSTGKAVTVSQGSAGSGGSNGSAGTDQTVGGGGGGGGGGGASGGGAGSGGGGTSSLPNGGQITNQGVSNGVIHLGAIVTQSGPGRSIPMAHAMIAWERSVNAAGGINGYKVDIDGPGNTSSIFDDQGNPDLGASQYRQLNEDQKVFALVGECAPLTDEAMVNYVNQAQLPLVGECQSAPEAYTSPYIYVGGPTPTQNGSLGALLMERTQSWPTSGGQIALVCLNDPTTIQDCNGAQSQYGSGALWNGGPQLEQIYDNNYSALIAQWQSAGVSHVHLILDPGSVDRYLQAAHDAGYNAQVFNNTVIDDGIAGPNGYASAEGMLIGTPWTPLDQNTPGMQRLAGALGTYFPNDKVDLYAQTAWVSCLILEHAIQTMGQNITRSNLIATLNSIHGWDTGLGPVEDFSPSNHVGPYESALMRLTGAGTGQWRLVTAHGAISG